MRIQPLGDHVLIKPLPKKAKTDGGLHIPDAALARRDNEVLGYGRVIAAGPGRYVQNGRWVDTSQMRPDMIVAYAIYSGIIVHEGEDLHLVRLDDVIATLAE